MELAITLDNRQAEPLHKQLYTKLRKAILNGTLLAGQKLPSTREIAQSLSISRTTATQSYDLLLQEGYLETRKGAGTFVSQQIPDDLFISISEKQKHNEVSDYRLSNYGKQISKEKRLQPARLKEAIYFEYGRPAFAALPWQLWKRLMIKHCTLNRLILDYHDDWQGYKPLREAIAHYLNRSRAVKCSYEQIIITSGSQQALDLCSRLLVSPGEKIAIEDPSYIGARKAFQANGAQIIPIPVDEAGLVTSVLPHRSKHNCKLVYVTPSHQFPTGAIMTLSRRFELLAWTRQNNTIIIEDDYDGEFRYSGQPIPSLQGLDDEASVIYIGTFSKVLFPALRIAYIVVPKALAPLFAQAKWLADRQSPMLEQCVLTEFIEKGHLERHIRRMRILYGEQRKTLVESLERCFGKQVSILGDSAGMHIMLRLPTKYSNDEFIKRTAKQGVILTDARLYYHNSGGKEEYILGYTDLSTKQIKEGVQRLSLAAKEAK